MSFGLESVIVTLVFLLPGFVATHIQSSRIPLGHVKRSAFQETLASLTEGIMILIVQVGLFLVLAKLFPKIGEEFKSLVEFGIEGYFSTYPFRSIFSLLIWILAGFSLSVISGIYDPLRRLTSFLSKKSKVNENDVWYTVLADQPGLQGLSSYVKVWMKSGMCYAGWISSFELSQANRTSRYFGLIQALRWENYSDSLDNKPAERLQAVLLNSNDVDSIDIWWIEPPE